MYRINGPFFQHTKTIHFILWKALLPVENTNQTLLVTLKNSSWLKTMATFRQANKHLMAACMHVCMKQKICPPPQNTQCVVLNKGSWEACGIAVGTRTTLNSHYLQASQAMLYLSPEAQVTEMMGLHVGLFKTAVWAMKRAITTGWQY